jgi:hypothetical protein
MEYYKNLGLEPIHYYCETEQDFKLEEFRAIKDYEGYYEVSDLGRVRSLERYAPHALYGLMRVEAKIRKQMPSGNGYLKLKLSSSGPQKSFAVHVLVAVAFLDHEPCGHNLVINHKNFDGTVNVKSNLEIVSQRKNADHKHVPHSSGFTGVNYKTDRKRWRAGIYIDGKRKHLGYFRDEIEASKAYENALNEHMLL